MIKRILIIVAVSLISFNASAFGLIDLGVKGGVTTGSYKFNNSTYGDYNVSTSSKMGFHVGAMARFNLLAMNIQPELIYSHNRYGMRTLSDEITSESTVRMNSLDLPVLFGFKVLFFKFQFGPMFNLSTDTSIKHKGDSNHWVKLDKPTVSYLVGFGIEVSKIAFDIRYNGQFKRPRQHTAVDGGEGFKSRMKFRSWMFSLGYLF